MTYGEKRDNPERTEAQWFQHVRQSAGSPTPHNRSLPTNDEMESSPFHHVAGQGLDGLVASGGEVDGVVDGVVDGEAGVLPGGQQLHAPGK